MKTQTRTEAIEGLRQALLAMTDDEHSACQVAKERGLFCHGFARWTFTELRKKYSQITRSRPGLTPAELENLANRWQLARQFVAGEGLSCDVQLQEGRRQTCRGWDEFSDAELEQFHRELCEQEIRIAPRATGEEGQRGSARSS